MSITISLMNSYWSIFVDQLCTYVKVLINYPFIWRCCETLMNQHEQEPITNQLEIFLFFADFTDNLITEIGESRKLLLAWLWGTLLDSVTLQTLQVCNVNADGFVKQIHCLSQQSHATVTLLPNFSFARSLSSECTLNVRQSHVCNPNCCYRINVVLFKLLDKDEQYTRSCKM